MTAENYTPGPHAPGAERRHWSKRIHHSPIFWIGVLMFCAAIAIYILTDDLAWRPRFG